MRSRFGSRGLQAVVKFFDKPEYHADASKVQEYADYALQVNGPALFKSPAPVGAPSVRDEPGFIVSCAIMLSS